MKRYVVAGNKNGITLIALVVTIILLLILAGTTLSMLFGNNGIIKKTIIAKEMTSTANEEEAISLEVQLINMNKNQSYIGKKLYDKNFENGNKWNIFIDTENSKRYGDGWYYIEPKTEIKNYGLTQYE